MKRKQWFTVCIGVIMVAGIYLLGDRTPSTVNTIASGQQHTSSQINIDTILLHAKEPLSPEQITRLETLETSVVRGDVKGQQLNVYHQLAHFWKDSARIFEPYAWYEAEAARLENSEKSLTFAAHLFLNNLQTEDNPQLIKWKAEQARDLFERSLKINPQNDSTQVGLGATYIFGQSENPMEGIQRVIAVTQRDSNNVFAQRVLGHGSVLSGQFDKAILRFEKVIQLQPANLEAILMLAEVYERKTDKQKAIKWYQKAFDISTNPSMKAELQKRILELSK